MEKMKISIGGSTIQAPAELTATAGCVYKLFYNDCYVIVVGETFEKSIRTLHQNVFYFIKGGKAASKPGSLYYKLCKHICDNPHGAYAVEVLFSSDKPYQLLKQGQMALFVAQNDPQCLNQSFEVYIGKYIQHPKSHQKWHWWANRGHYLNFKRWLKAELLRQQSLATL